MVWVPSCWENGERIVDETKSQWGKWDNGDFNGELTNGDFYIFLWDLSEPMLTLISWDKHG